VTEGLSWSLELSVDTSNIHIDSEILASDHYLTVFVINVIALV